MAAGQVAIDRLRRAYPGIMPATVLADMPVISPGAQRKRERVQRDWAALDRLRRAYLGIAAADIGASLPRCEDDGWQAEFHDRGAFDGLAAFGLERDARPRCGF